MDDDGKFPSCHEKAGYWLRPAEHVGDILTYDIFSDDTNTIIQGSSIRPADPSLNHGYKNVWAMFDSNMDPEITLHEDNANVQPEPVEFSKEYIPVKRSHTRQYRLRKWTPKHKLRTQHCMADTDDNDVAQVPLLVTRQ